MNYYRNNRRINKKNQRYEGNSEKESSTTEDDENTNCQKAKQNKVQDMATLVSRFHSIVSQGPLYICSCCDQVWYKHSVFPAAKIRKLNPAAEKYLLKTKSVNNEEWLCRTCHNYLARNKVPPVALLKGMEFPMKPDFFYLNELECGLVAPRLEFQKLMQVPRGRQLKMHGNVVNVPAEVSDIVNMLPRLPSDTSTIKVHLKRKLQYKSSALSLNIRPHKVIQVANWLINNSSLFKQEGITINQEWGVQCSANYLLDETNTENQNEQSEEKENSSSCKKQSSINGNDVIDSDDRWTADEAEIPAGVTDTLLSNTDFFEDSEPQHILNVAPGEGTKPLSIFRDQYSEELAYPGIFLGQGRPGK